MIRHATPLTVVWVDGRRRWFRAPTEDEARFLQACFIHRRASEGTVKKAIAILSGEL